MVDVVTPGNLHAPHFDVGGAVPNKITIRQGSQFLSGAAAPSAAPGPADPPLYIETGTNPDTLHVFYAGAWHKVGGADPLNSCAGAPHAAGASVPSCAEMTAAIAAAIAAIPGEKFLQGLQGYDPNTNIMTLLLNDGTTVPVDMSALVTDILDDLLYATTPEIQSGFPDKIVTVDNMAAAHQAGVTNRIFSIGNGVRIQGTDLDSSGQGVFGLSRGAGAGNAVNGFLDGSGVGSGVNGRNAGSGPGSGVYGEYLGTGNGRAGYFVSSGATSGDVVTATNSGGTGNGNVLNALHAGSGNGSAVRGTVGGNVANVGTGPCAMFINGQTGVRNAVGEFIMQGANTTWGITTNGPIFTAGGVTTSDERVKENIATIDDVAAEKLWRALPFVDYVKLLDLSAVPDEDGDEDEDEAQTKKGSPARVSIGKQAGVSAQHLQKLTGELGAFHYLVKLSVPSDPESILCVDYQSLFVILMAGQRRAILARE